MTSPSAAAPNGVLLLVEDDPDHAFLVRRQLRERLGLELSIEQLGTARAAAERLAEGDVRCVVLDLSLPDAKGLEAVLALRQAAPEVPIVVLTGLDSDEVGRQAVELGAQDYLVKGQHGTDALVRSVVFALERSKRHAAERVQAQVAGELRLVHAALLEAQALARLGSWEWDLASDEVVWSQEMFRVTGLVAAELPSDGKAFVAFQDLVPLAERAELRALFATRSAGGDPVVVVHRLVRPDGEQRWVQSRATIDEALTRLVGTVQDITDQKVAEDLLAHQALHDVLTGLPNRGLLLDRLERRLADPRRGAVAVVFMDLDRFKWVNDSVGHAAGDELLVDVAARLTAVVRPSDTLARFGGDEFVLVCENLTDERQLFEVVERLAHALEIPFKVGDQEVVVTASMGLAVASAGEDVESEGLIRDADTAMYRAKDNGRARCEIFDEAMRERASQRLEVQVDLRMALLRDEIQAWYQPVVDITTGRVVGCEALARWQHPTKGLLMPMDFIPHAEETGAIVPLGAALLLQACEQVQSWNRARPDHEPLYVAVNVSARQLSSPKLVETVREALAVSGLPARLLMLEVTESVVMQDVVMSGAVLGLLRELGVMTAVDDFGTGFSSLAYLLSLPVDLLKIDRSFVQALDDEGGPASAIVRAIAALAEALGLRVLAEGVELVEQLAELDEIGVQCGQGYLWGRAVPAHEAAWASRWSSPVIPLARESVETPLAVGSQR